MKNANEDLEKEIAAGRGQEMVLDSVDDDGKDYIEMVGGISLPSASLFEEPMLTDHV